jgi:type VI secretion system secreted protein Hcp
MYYEGADGGVTSKDHEKWIKLNSFQWGVGRAIGTAARGAATREADTPTVSEIVVTKFMDGASAKLWMESVAGSFDNTVKIDFCKTDTSEPEPYLQYTLLKTGISGYSLSSGGDRPTETLSLNFTKVEYKNIGMGAANETGTPDVGHYDLTTETGS